MRRIAWGAAIALVVATGCSSGSKSAPTTTVATYGEQYHVNGAEHDVDSCALHVHVVDHCVADLDHVHNDVDRPASTTTTNAPPPAPA